MLIAEIIGVLSLNHLAKYLPTSIYAVTYIVTVSVHYLI